MEKAMELEEIKRYAKLLKELQKMQRQWMENTDYQYSIICQRNSVFDTEPTWEIDVEIVHDDLFTGDASRFIFWGIMSDIDHQDRITKINKLYERLA